MTDLRLVKHAEPIGGWNEHPVSINLSEFMDQLRPAWYRLADCQFYPSQLFYPPPGADSAQQAKAVCEACPVRDQCLGFALDNHERFGIWGGLTYRERLIHARQHRRTHAG